MSNRAFLYSVAAILYTTVFGVTVLISTGCSLKVSVSSHETVTRVVDGDTLELSNGDTVRLIGIDAPELNTPEGGRAANRLTQLTLHQPVVLTKASQDEDRYGRKLRYVQVRGTDVGLEMIVEGLAVARYDSRDGYPSHPREDAYHAITQVSLPVTPSCDMIGQEIDRSDPRYTPRLDGDGDGRACEETR